MSKGKKEKKRGDKETKKNIGFQENRRIAWIGVMIIVNTILISFCGSEKTLEVPKYKVDKGTKFRGSTSYVRYTFEGEPKPKLSLASEGAIAEVSSINEALRLLNLPEISHGVPELESITGSRMDRGFYYWEDYPLGTLILNRTTCGGWPNIHDCIWSITIAQFKKQ